MILVDSSVWIDRLADRDTQQTRAATWLLQAGQLLAVGDLILAEVLQGTRDSLHFARTEAILAMYEQVTIVDRGVAIEAARHFQHLRRIGLTVRKTIDLLIATRCIMDGLPLLYADRDFDPFVEHLGLRSALNLVPE